MEVIDFLSTTQFDSTHTISNFVYPPNENKPSYIYRHDHTKFELIEATNAVVYELTIEDIDKDIEEIQFQYAQYFYSQDKLLFFIATQTTDGLETFLYICDPLLKSSSTTRLLFTRKLKGQISNIFISKTLKNGTKDDYRIMTIGTLDSALYVIRFTCSDISIIKKEELKEKENKTPKFLACGLARTDARNAITQEIAVLNNQSKSPANVYIICAGSNGIMDFFLLKGNADLDTEPVLEYQRHDCIELPSNLPIVSLQCLENTSDNKQILLAVCQELFNPIRISRTLEPSMTVLKLSIKDLFCKETVSTKFPCGTHVSPLLKTSDSSNYKLWSCFSEEELMLTATQFIPDEFKFSDDKTNTFLTLPETKELQQISFIDEKTCWMLRKQSCIKTTSIRKSHKRQLST